MTKISALNTPAPSRSSSHTAVLCVSGMAASEATSAASAPRSAARERTSRGRNVPARAPTR